MQWKDVSTNFRKMVLNQGLTYHSGKKQKQRRSKDTVEKENIGKEIPTCTSVGKVLVLWICKSWEYSIYSYVSVVLKSVNSLARRQCSQVLLASVSCCIALDMIFWGDKSLSPVTVRFIFSCQTGATISRTAGKDPSGWRQLTPHYETREV